MAFSSLTSFGHVHCRCLIHDEFMKEMVMDKALLPE